VPEDHGILVRFSGGARTLNPLPKWSHKDPHRLQSVQTGCGPTKTHTDYYSTDNVGPLPRNRGQRARLTKVSIQPKV